MPTQNFIEESVKQFDDRHVEGLSQEAKDYFAQCLRMSLQSFARKVVEEIERVRPPILVDGRITEFGEGRMHMADWITNYILSLANLPTSSELSSHEDNQP